MNRRSLLDYLADAETGIDVRHPEEGAVASLNHLETRLRELEARLNLPAEEPVGPGEEPHLAGQIEAILKRRDRLQPAPAHRDIQQEQPMLRPAPAMARMTVPPPSLAHEAIQPAGFVADDFRKFAEAVQLIGQAAARFTGGNPSAPAVPQSTSTVLPEIAALTSVVHEAITAFRSVADDIAVSAAELRRSAERPSQVEDRPSRRPGRDDAELHRLQDDLEELSERLSSVIARRRANRY